MNVGSVSADAPIRWITEESGYQAASIPEQSSFLKLLFVGFVKVMRVQSEVMERSLMEVQSFLCENGHMDLLIKIILHWMQKELREAIDNNCLIWEMLCQGSPVNI